VQIAQTVLSGSKALMFFQTSHAIIDDRKTDTSLMRDTIFSIRTISEIVRAGDIAGVSFKTSSKLIEEVMVETILSPSQLLIVVVNADAHGYSNLLCHTGIDRHWQFAKHTLGSLELDLRSAPQIRSLSNWQEVHGQQLKPPKNVTIKDNGQGTVTLSQLQLDDQMVARFFVANVSWT
jgi:hypothetical protein